MVEVDIQADLNIINDQITKMVEELNKITVTRDQMIQQIQNINGVAMYLRGKLPQEQQKQGVAEVETSVKDTSVEEDNITRKVEYP